MKPVGPDIYLIRHGHVEHSPRKKFIGQTDLPLSPRGAAQAQSLARTLSRAGLTRLVSSDLKRARTTAEIIAGAVGLEVELSPELREIYLGEWEGLAMDEVRAAYPEEFERRGDDLENFRPPGGESFGDLSQRVWPVFQSLAREGAGNAALVTHAGVIRVIICRALEMPLGNMFLLQPGYGGFAVLSGSGRPRLTRFNAVGGPE